MTKHHYKQLCLIWIFLLSWTVSGNPREADFLFSAARTDGVDLRAGAYVKNGLLHLDGKKAYAVIPDSRNFHPVPQGLTLMATISPEEDSPEGTAPEALDMYFMKADEFLFGRLRNSLYVNFHNGQSWCAPLTVPCSLPAGKRSKVAMVFSPESPSGGTVSLYLNGKRIAAKTFSGLHFQIGSAPVEIGKGWEGGRWFFKGGITDLAILKRPLSDQEITVFHKSGRQIRKYASSGDDSLIPGRIFFADFENPDGTAVFGQGGIHPVNEFHTGRITGFDGRNAYQPVKGSRQLQYPAPGNADPRQGTAVIWMRAENFSPADLSRKNIPNRWQIRPIPLFSIRLAENASCWSELNLSLIRSYDAAGLRFSCQTSGFPHIWGKHPNLPICLSKIQTGRWHQVACTWDTKKISIYLDGQYQGSSMMLRSKAEPLLKMNPLQGHIRLRGDDREQAMQRGEKLSIDDFAVYSRILSPAEIHWLHARQNLQNPSPHDLMHCTFQGAYENGEERVQADIDFTMLRRLLPDLVPENTSIRCRIFDDTGVCKISTSFLLGRQPAATLYFAGLSEAGTYRLEMTFQNRKITRMFRKPDTSWCGSTAGTEDITPAPWTPPVLKGDTVYLWNREYRFGSGPLPVKILNGGRNLLASPVKIMVRSNGVSVALQNRTTEKIQKNSCIILRGILESENFSASYETKVDFDGFIQTTLRMNRDCAVEALHLHWQMAEAFRKRLFLPAPDFCNTKIREFSYFDQNPLGKIPPGALSNHSNSRTPYLIHYASEQGGFCWMPANDDNWIYAPEEKIFRIDKETGECRIRVITRPVVIPRNAVYTFCFIATPSRPLLKNFRAWRFSGRNQAGDERLQYHCFQQNGNLLISGKKIKRHTSFPKSLQLYAATEFLRNDSPEARWFCRNWLTFGYAYGSANDIALPSCVNSSRSDFLAENTLKSLSLPEFRYVAGYYFDCCQLNLCDNPLHGCRHTDSFGRQITGTNLLGLRNFMKRIVRLLHSRGRIVGAHQQNSFCPGIHGLCDYWLTGEELRSYPLLKGAGIYCDTSVITDEHLRTIENHRYLSNTGACMMLYTDRTKYGSLTPGITRMLLEDIKCIGWFNETEHLLIDRIWKAFAFYKADSGTVHRFFEQKHLKSSNPNVRLTYYTCPENRLLVIAGNLSDQPQKTSVDCSHFRKGIFSIRDELSDEILPASDSEVTVTVPEYGFRILGIR